MRRRLALLLLLAACRQTTPPVAAPPVRPARLALANFRPAWRIEAALASYARVLSADDVLVFPADPKRRMFELSDGRIRGALSDTPGTATGAPRLLVEEDGWHAYDARSGQKLWSWTPGEAFDGSNPPPLVFVRGPSRFRSRWNALVARGPDWLSVEDEPALYAIAVDPANGTERWRTEVFDSALFVPDWQANATHLAVVGDRTMSVFGLASPKPLWTGAAPEQVRNLLLTDRAVIVRTDTVFTARDLATGAVLAESPIDSWTRLDELSPARDTVFVTALDSTEIQSWRLPEGPAAVPRWSVESGCASQPSVEAVDPDALYVTCRDGDVDSRSFRLAVREAATGELVEEHELPVDAGVEFVTRPGGDVAMLQWEKERVTIWARVP